MKHEELLNSKVTGLFRGSFVEYIRPYLEEGFDCKKIGDYFSSKEFQKLNNKHKGLGPAYIGLVIHRLLDSYKLRLKNGKYFNGDGKGVDGNLNELLTRKERGELVRILEDDISIKEM